MLRCAVPCLLALSACTLDFDMVGPKGGGGPVGAGPNGGNAAGAGQSGGNSQTGGNGEGGTPISDCSGDGGRCVAIPLGFQGAVLVSPQPCGAASLVFDGFGDFSAADASCGCSCVPESSQCGLPGIAMSFSNSTCEPSGETGTFVPSSVCAQVPGGNGTHSVRLGGVLVAPGCISNGATPTLPGIDWTEPITGCAFESLGCDGADVCAPADGTRYCFYRPTAGPAIECPAGFIDTRVVEPADIEDDRDCVCECGAANFSNCSAPVWSVHGDAGCTDELNAESGTCVSDAGRGSILSARVTAQATVGCTQGQMVSGGVSGLPSLQVCCSP